jgi:hypothetical protein
MALLDYLPDAEKAQAKEWLAGRQKRYMGCIGGQFTLKITETSLGDIYILADDSDDSEINLTDFGSW